MAKDQFKMFQLNISSSKIIDNDEITKMINKFLANPHFEYLNHQTEIIKKPVLFNSRGNSQQLFIEEIDADHKGLQTAQYFKRIALVDNILVVTLMYRDYSSDMDLTNLNDETASLIKNTLKSKTKSKKPEIPIESDVITLGVVKS